MENIEITADAPQEIPVTISKTSKGNLRKTLFLFSYLSAIPIFLIFLVLFSLSVKYQSNGYISRQAHQPKYQALPGESTNSSVVVETTDARVKALESFFARYNSPLQGHAQTIVDEADKNKLDYRLLPGIAMQESTLCKKIIKDSYNCWGFGIYGKKVTRFDSYDQAIAVISSTLAKKYIQQGFTNPDEIVQKYTPSDTGRWPTVVNLIMQKLTDSL